MNPSGYSIKIAIKNTKAFLTLLGSVARVVPLGLTVASVTEEMVGIFCNL